MIGKANRQTGKQIELIYKYIDERVTGSIARAVSSGYNFL